MHPLPIPCAARTTVSSRGKKYAPFQGDSGYYRRPACSYHALSILHCSARSESLAISLSSPLAGSLDDSMVIDDKKEPYCGLSIVKDTLTEARRVIMVMTFKTTHWVRDLHPPARASPPSACVSSCRTSCCPPRRTPSPRAWRPSPAQRRARAAASATCRRRARART